MIVALIMSLWRLSFKNAMSIQNKKIEHTDTLRFTTVAIILVAGQHRITRIRSPWDSWTPEPGKAINDG